MIAYDKTVNVQLTMSHAEHIDLCVAVAQACRLPRSASEPEHSYQRFIARVKAMYDGMESFREKKRKGDPTAADRVRKFRSRKKEEAVAEKSAVAKLERLRQAKREWKAKHPPTPEQVEAARVRKKLAREKKRNELPIMTEAEKMERKRQRKCHNWQRREAPNAGRETARDGG